MKPFIILQIVLVSFVLFFIISYAIGYHKENRALDEIILVKKEMDEDEDDYFDEIEHAQSNFYKIKFKIRLMRSLVFSGAMGALIYYMSRAHGRERISMLSRNKYKGMSPAMEQPMTKMGPPTLIRQDINKRQDMRHMFFDTPPF